MEKLTERAVRVSTLRALSLQELEELNEILLVETWDKRPRKTVAVLMPYKFYMRMVSAIIAADILTDQENFHGNVQSEDQK